MTAARKGFGTVSCQLLAPLMNGGVRNAQLAGYLCNRFSAGLSQADRFTFKLDFALHLTLVGS
jgi:hypothetical protein